MTRILSHVFFVTTVYLNLAAQVINTAVICDPLIGKDQASNHLISAINDISSRSDIDLVVILGNLTNSGSYDEFIELETTLYNLNVPFRVIGGPNDILLSEAKGEEIVRFCPECQNTVHSKLSDKLFIQTLQYQNSKMSHIPVEKLNKIAGEKNNNKNIMIFSYNDFENEIDNSFKLANLLEGKNLISINTSKEQREKHSASISEIILFRMSSGKSWNYTILKESNDSLAVFKISEKQLQPEIVSSFTLNEITPQEIIDSSQTMSYLDNLKFHQLNDNSFTTFTPILYSGEKIFTASKSGKITCTDNDDNKLWEYNTYSSIFNSTLADRDLTISVPYEGDIFTINVNNGNLFQVIGIGEYVTSDICFVDIEFNETKTKGIIAGTSTGNTYCYELYSLEMVWSNNISMRPITSNPLVAEDKIIFRDDSENYYCINSVNGLLIWQWNNNSNNESELIKSESCINKSSLFTSDSYGNVFSVDILLGTNNWKNKKANSSGQLFWSSFRASLLVHTTKNKILEIDLASGKTISELSLPEEFYSKLPSAWFENEENILIGFDNGIIAMLDNHNEFKKVIFTGNASIVSIISSAESDYITNNLDGKVTAFTLPQTSGE